MITSAPAKTAPVIASDAPAGVRTHKPGKEFMQVLDELKRTQGRDPLGLDIRQELVNLETALRQGRGVSTAELLMYQMKVGQVGIKIELLSKIAEGALSTVRKLQGPG